MAIATETWRGSTSVFDGEGDGARWGHRGRAAFRLLTTVFSSGIRVCDHLGRKAYLLN